MVQSMIKNGVQLMFVFVDPSGLSLNCLWRVPFVSLYSYYTMKGFNGVLVNDVYVVVEKIVHCMVVVSPI